MIKLHDISSVNALWSVRNVRLTFLFSVLSVFFFYSSHLQARGETNFAECTDTADCRLLHFWDNVDFSDSSFVNNRPSIEEKFTLFISCFQSVNSLDSVAIAVDSLLKKSSTNHSALISIMDIAEDNLYSTSSAFFSEDYYRPFLEWVLSHPELDVIPTERYAYQLEALDKNMPGSIAPDFEYINPEGLTTSLYKTLSRNRLLLIFYDPECDHCIDTIEKLRESPEIEDAVNEGVLDILAIYPDADPEVWIESLNADFPAEWYRGMESGSIMDNDLYQIRTFPTLYLLDKERKIEVKNFKLNDRL